MGVRNDWKNGTSQCICGSCGSIIGPFKTEAELRKNMNNWSYIFRDDIGEPLGSVHPEMRYFVQGQGMRRF